MGLLWEVCPRVLQNSLNSIILPFIYLTMSYSPLLILLVIFDTNLSFTQHILSISKSCFHNNRDQRRIRNTIDQTIACTIATSLIHSKINYCNRSYYHSAPVLRNNLPSHLCQVVHHLTPSPISNSPVSDLSTFLFLKKLKTHLFHSTFPP